MEIGQIIKGNVNNLLGLNKNLQEERIKICKKCPIYSSRLGGLCNASLWFNPKTNDVSTEKKDGYVRGCGCILKAKTTLPNAKCVAGKW